MEPDDKPEILIEHAGFVRALARGLVADEHRAADIAQDTLLAVLEQKPDTQKPLRAWLSRVAHNLARRSHRTATRRARREREEPPREPVTPPDRIVESEEMLRCLTEAVLSLDESYRTAVLCRYYEEMSPNEIADRLGIPVGTVKTRLKRGLAMLRQRLDKRFGDRGSWCLALVSLAGMKTIGDSAAATAPIAAGASAPAAPAAAAPAAAASAAAATANLAPGTLLFGGSVMAVKAKVGLVAALVLAATALVLWQILPRTPEDTPSASDHARVHPFEESGAAFSEEDVGDGAAARAQPINRVPVTTQGPFLAGRVADKVTGAPVEDFEITLTRLPREVSTSATVRKEPIREVVSHTEGRFHIPVPRGGSYRLAVYSRRYCTKRINDLEIPESTGRSDCLVTLDPGFSVSGRVVDHVSGQPVAGALVAPSDPMSRCGLEDLLQGRSERLIHARTDERGEFHLSGLQRSAVGGSVLFQSVVAVHDDYAQGWEPLVPGETESIEIRLEKGHHIFGHALDDDGRPASGVAVEVSCDAIPLWLYTLTDENGCYRTPAVRPGYVTVRARVQVNRDRDSELPGFTTEEQSVKVIDRDLAVDFGPRPEHVIWHGTLHGLDRRPAPRATIFLFKQDADRRKARLSGTAGLSFSLRTDDAGRFELRKLLPGRYSARFILSDRSTIDHDPLLVLDRPGRTEMDVHLGVEEPDGYTGGYTGAISGVVIDGATGGPFTPDRKVRVDASWDRSNRRKAKVDSEGRFRLENLPAATYQLSIFAAGAPGKILHGIRLSEGQRRTGLRIAVPPGGDLKIVLEGFNGDDPRRFELGRRRRASAKTYRHTQRLEPGGTWEQTRTVEVGLWTVTVAFEELGVVERQAEVFAGALTTIVVHRDELVPAATAPPDQRTATVAGSLTRPDGTPMPARNLAFFTYQVEGLEPGTLLRRAATDLAGLFTVEGLRPGMWTASLLAEQDDSILWTRHFSIPESPDDGPHPLNLVVPTGSVSGNLCNGMTGESLSSDSLPWDAMVSKAGTYSYWNKDSGPTPHGRFTVPGIPEEEFYLSIRAQGFWPYESETFVHPGTGDVDVGRMMLDPCGVLKLEVTDPDGNPVAACLVFIDNHRVFPERDKLTPEGSQLFDRLSCGPVRLEIKALGFRSWEGLVDLPPGIPFELVVSLDRQ